MFDGTRQALLENKSGAFLGLDESNYRQSSFARGAVLQRNLWGKSYEQQSGRERRERENFTHLGGMRNASRTPHLHTGWKVLGITLRAAIHSLLDDYPEVESMVEQLRAGKTIQGVSNDLRKVARTRMFNTLVLPEPPLPERADYHWVEAICWAAGDPDGLHISTWLTPGKGAPMGLGGDIPTVGIYPPPKKSADTSDTRLDDLTSNQLGWSNYKTLEDDLQPGLALVEAARAKGFCTTTRSWEHLVALVGTANIVMQKVGMVSKLRGDGTYKHRLIWDFLRSCLNAHIELHERIVLPRIEDATSGAIRLARENGSAMDLEWLVLDFADAFHQVHLRPDLWGYNVAKIGDLWIVFKVLSFGGRSFPNIWGRVVGLVGRATGSILDSASTDVQIFVDDPIIAAGGSVASRTRNFAMVFIIFALFGLDLSWAKASLGNKPTWIGVTFTAQLTSFTVSIPQERTADLLAKTLSLRTAKANPFRELRSYVGVVGYFAGVIVWLKPFAAIIWGAMAEVERMQNLNRRMKAATGQAIIMVPTRRILIAFKWISAFLTSWLTSSRQFNVWPTPVLDNSFIATDASPWGMGGILVVAGTIVRYFATGLTAEDLRHFNASRGVSDWTTLWEGLALLIAAKLWLSVPNNSCVLRVKSDSLGALRAAMKLSSPSPSLNSIAREFAVLLATRHIDMSLLEHIPGVSNEIPDCLSRLESPKPKQLPTCLREVSREAAPPRDGKFWLVT
jgi:hypothetical protein